MSVYILDILHNNLWQWFNFFIKKEGAFTHAQSVGFNFNKPVLLLNANYQPLSWFPLSVVSWKEALKAFFLDRVDVVAEYADIVHAPNFSMRIPSVIVLKAYVLPQKKPPFSRFNLYLRDRFMCQYCGAKGLQYGAEGAVRLTLDHVHPRSRGGHLSWLNAVAACETCNLKKGNKTPDEAHMQLLQKPFVPTQYQLQKRAEVFTHHPSHESWQSFL